MKRFARASIAWRLYLVGLAQVFLFFTATLVIGAFLRLNSSRWDPSAISERIDPVFTDPEKLVQLLQEIRAEGGPEISVYDSSRLLVASNVTPALPPPDWNRPPLPPRPPGSFVAFQLRVLFNAGPPASRRPRDFYGRLSVAGGEGTLVVRHGDLGFGLWPVVLSLVSAFTVVALGTLLTTRFLVQPLRDLAQTATTLGKGDLRARTNLRRDDEIGDVGRAFDEMAERIQSLLLVDKELMANVAHELRTPLARIRVALEIASEGDYATARASLAEMAVDVAELETLVSDVLTATNLDLAADSPPSRLPLRRHPMSPGTLAREAEARFRARFPTRDLDVHVAGGLPSISADPILMRRALDNLLENAQKYSPPSEDAIELAVSYTKEQVLFRVSDRGIGIPPADLTRVFSPFFRSERSRSRDAGGVGLGLTLVKQIVEAHAGSVEITSELGSGTTVSVLLPVAA
jgi:signal transduction histidine kinase